MKIETDVPEVLGILQVFENAFRHPGLRLAATAAIAERIPPDITPQAVMLANLGAIVLLLSDDQFASDVDAVHVVNNAVDIVRRVVQHLNPVGCFVPRVPVKTADTMWEAEGCRVFFEGLRDLVAGLSGPLSLPSSSLTDADADAFQKSAARVALIPAVDSGAQKGIFRAGVWQWDPIKGKDAGPFDVLLVESGHDPAWLRQARSRLKVDGYEVACGGQIGRVTRRPDNDEQPTAMEAIEEAAPRPARNRRDRVELNEEGTGPLHVGVLLADGLNGARSYIQSFLPPDVSWLAPRTIDSSAGRRFNVLLVEQGAEEHRIAAARERLCAGGFEMRVVFTAKGVRLAPTP